LALAPVLPQLQRTAPPERSQLLRDALERAGVNPSWAEWETYAGELLATDEVDDG
jgi:hypothetical protein